MRVAESINVNGRFLKVTLAVGEEYETIFKAGLITIYAVNLTGSVGLIHFPRTNGTECTVMQGNFNSDEDSAIRIYKAATGGYIRIKNNSSVSTPVHINIL